MSEAGGSNEREEGRGVPSNFSEMLDKVLSNPEIISSVAAALSKDGDKPTEEERTDEPKEKERSADTPDVEAMMQRLPDMMKVIAPMMSKGKRSAEPTSSGDKRTCLLTAIKPYLSPHRCEAVDYIIRFSEISEVIKKLN